MSYIMNKFLHFIWGKNVKSKKERGGKKREKRKEKRKNNIKIQNK